MRRVIFRIASPSYCLNNLNLASGTSDRLSVSVEMKVVALVVLVPVGEAAVVVHGSGRYIQQELFSQLWYVLWFLVIDMDPRRDDSRDNGRRRTAR